MKRLRPLATLLLLGLSAPAGAGVPDREATIIVASGMSVGVERATFFDDGGLIALGVRNSTYEVARPRIRVVVFDERGGLRGTVAYCAGLVQPGTRQPLVIPLEIKGASTRDRFVVFVEEVLTPRRAYTLREPLEAALREARKSIDARGWDLTLREAPRSGDIPDCPCDCATAEQLAVGACGAGALQAYTCTPMAPGCSEGASCKEP